MGEVKNQLFLQHIDKSLEEVRTEFRKKHIPKKDNRFLIKGITYEIGPCRIDSDGYLFEISSKIPQEVLPKKVGIDKYFREVVKIITTKPKKPIDWKMENIIRSSEEELKERDYVKLTYRYKENELYTLGEVEKRLKKYIAKGIPIPDAPGVATPVGKMVLHVIEESIKTQIRQNLMDLFDANETIKKQFESKFKTADAASVIKNQEKPRTPVSVSKPKPVAKKTAKPKPAVKKPVPAKSVKKPAPKKKPSPSKASSRKVKK